MHADGQSTMRGNPSAVQAREIPDHELLGLIGRGAYGEVWLARNAIGTLRAVKIVHRESFGRVEHFEREFKGLLKFEPLSRSHAGLVDVLQIGRRDDAGYFFYVMELADGLNAEREVRSAELEESGAQRTPHSALLNPHSYAGSTPHSALRTPHSYAPRTLRSELQARGSLPPAECVNLGLKLASALEHLHANGLVHRDIKPSNIIFVNGEPKLADIGLVTAIDEAQSLVGTVGYIPPEGPGTAQADLYSLGKVLYEIAFGKDRQEFPQLPPDLQSHPDYTALLELNEIILKACETDPRLRYASATALREDLELLQKGHSVRGVRQVERHWRRARHAAAWLTAGVAVLALVVMASRVHQKATTVRPERRSTNEVANNLFDLGKAHFDQFNETNFQVAADYFKRAIKVDTNFAQAYGYLAAIYSCTYGEWNPNWKFLPQAKEMALQALKLDDSLAEPHIALATYHFMREWDWNDAEMEEKRAIQLNPSSSLCHLCYAECLRARGHTLEALEQLNEAKALDPHSRFINKRLASNLVDARRWNEALIQMDQVSAMDPTEDMIGERRSVLCAVGRYVDAIGEERKSRTAAGESKDKLDLELDKLEHAVKTDGPKAYWLRELANAKNWNYPYGETRAYAQLGETNAAITCLNTCLNNFLKDGDASLTFSVMTDWTLDPVRPDPRFHAILKTMHLE
jgi:serine/threonine protein kinase